MTTLEKYNNDHVESNDVTEGVDERAIARVEQIAFELEKRIDNCCYKGYVKAYSSGRANLEHHYDAFITSDQYRKKKFASVNSVELISASQYARKKRKTTNDATKPRSIGYEYLSLANDCYLSHAYSNITTHASHSKMSKNINIPIVPFVPCSPIGMMSLGQAVAFHPKARIIVEAASSLRVVFANSAYYRLSGLSSQAILNFPLCRLTHAEFSFSTLIKCVQRMEAGSHTSVNITTQSIDSLSGNQVHGQLKCQMHAFPIVADINYAYVKNYSSSSASSSSNTSSGLRNVTHFLIEFTYLDSTLDILEDLMDNGIKSSKQAFTLMG